MGRTQRVPYSTPPWPLKPKHHHMQLFFLLECGLSIARRHQRTDPSTSIKARRLVCSGNYLAGSHTILELGTAQQHWKRPAFHGARNMGYPQVTRCWNGIVLQLISRLLSIKETCMCVRVLSLLQNVIDNIYENTFCPDAPRSDCFPKVVESQVASIEEASNRNWDGHMDPVDRTAVFS